MTVSHKARLIMSCEFEVLGPGTYRAFTLLQAVHKTISSHRWLSHVAEQWTERPSKSDVIKNVQIF